MAIYSWGKDKSSPHVKHAFDANGLEIKDNVREIDTNTGDAIIDVRDENGELVIDYDKGEILTKSVKYVPPILLIWA